MLTVERCLARGRRDRRARRRHGAGRAGEGAPQKQQQQRRRQQHQRCPAGRRERVDLKIHDRLFLFPWPPSHRFGEASFKTTRQHLSQQLPPEDNTPFTMSSSSTSTSRMPRKSSPHEVRRLFALHNHIGAGSAADIIRPAPVAAEGQPQAVYRADYKSPDFLIPKVELHFALGVGVEHTIVTGSLSCERVGAAGSPLVLDGEGLNLMKLSVNGAPVDASMYTITAETNASTTLTILGAALPADATFTVETTVEIFPEANHQAGFSLLSPSLLVCFWGTFCLNIGSNLALLGQIRLKFRFNPTQGDGLYMSNSTFCTQCEPQGFRRKSTSNRRLLACNFNPAPNSSGGESWPEANAFDVFFY